VRHGGECNDCRTRITTTTTTTKNRGATMDYMILIHHDETTGMPAPGEPGFDQAMAAWMTFNQTLIDGGHWISGGSLQPTATATTVRKSFDVPNSITDGPFAETKEQLGGFYLISADDLDAALELAAAVPIPVGSVEVRPVKFRPDAT
jgi:hypothetical protein